MRFRPRRPSYVIQDLWDYVWVNDDGDKAHGDTRQWTQRAANRSDRYLSDKIGGIGGGHAARNDSKDGVHMVIEQTLSLIHI